MSGVPEPHPPPDVGHEARGLVLLLQHLHRLLVPLLQPLSTVALLANGNATGTGTCTTGGGGGGGGGRRKGEEEEEGGGGGGGRRRRRRGEEEEGGGRERRRKGEEEGDGEEEGE